MENYKEFYPTPEELVNKMLDGVNLNYVKTVLEPSAGKGNIIQGLKNHARYQNLDIDCIEINKDLRNCLKGGERYQKRYAPYGTVAGLYLWAIAGGAIPELTDPAGKR